MSMQHILAAVLLLGLAGGAAFFLLEDDGLDPAARRDVTATSTDEAPVRRRSQPTESGIETRRFDEGIESAWDEEFADAEDGLRFALITDRDGRPVPFAEVRLVATTSERRGIGGFGDDAPPREYRDAFRSGPDGFALLTPLPRRRFRIIGVKDGLVGSALYEQGNEAKDLPKGADALVVLHPIKRLTVDVVDAGGSPSPHVRILAGPAGETPGGRGGFGGRGGRGGRGRGGFGGRDRSERGGGSSGLSRWTSTPDGRAVLEISKATPELFDADQLDVHALLPGKTRVTEGVAMPRQGDVQVTLRIPLTVALSLHLVDREGKPFKDPTTVSWFVEAESAPSPREGEGGNGGRRGRGRGGFDGFTSNSPVGQQTITGGHAVIGGFAPNAKVHFTARVRGRVEETTICELTSQPSQAFDVLVGDLEPHLLMTLVDPSGEPIPRVRLSTEITYDGDPNDEGASRQQRLLRMMTRDRDRGGRGGRGGRGSTTGSDGELTLTARTRMPGELTIRVRREASGGFGRGRGRGGRGGESQEEPPLAIVRFDALEPGERRDLGEVKANAYAVLAEGIVLNAAGEPVDGARVRVDTTNVVSAENNSRAGRGRGRGGFGGRGDRGGRGGGRGGRGGGRGGLSGRSNEDGRFVVRGFAQADKKYTIVAESRRASSQVQDLIPGARDLRLVVRETGGLAGRVRIADPTLDARIEARVRPMNGTPDAEGEQLRLRREGAFQVTDLAPGQYELEVEVNGVKDTVIPGLNVPDGEVARPGAIADLVVGVDLYRAEVTVLDGAGAPVSGASVSFTADGRTVRGTSGIGSGGGGSEGRRGRGGRGGAERERGGRGGTERGRGGRGGRGRRGGASTDDLGRASAVLHRSAVVVVKASADGFAPASINQARFPLTIRLTGGEGITVRLGSPIPQVEGARSWRLVLGDPNETVDTGDRRSVLRLAMRGGALNQTVNAGASEVTFENVTAGTYAVRLIATPDFRGRRGRSGNDGNGREGGRSGRRGGRGARGGGGTDRGARGGGRGSFTPVVITLGQISVQQGAPSQVVQVPLNPSAVINAMNQ